MKTHSIDSNKTIGTKILMILEAIKKKREKKRVTIGQW